jgi:hypothetical protein
VVTTKRAVKTGKQDVTDSETAYDASFIGGETLEQLLRCTDNNLENDNFDVRKTYEINNAEES